MTIRSTLVLLSLVVASCASHSPADAAIEFRVASYNVKHGKAMVARSIPSNLARQAEILKGLDCDVIALQEIDRGCRRSESIDEPAFFAKALSMKFAFGAFMEYDGGEYGLAMLQRFSEAETERLALPPGRHEPRCALIQTITIAPGLRVVVVDVHFDWLRKSPERLAQAESLLARLGDVDLPTIVIGDYNAGRDSPTLDAFRAAGFECLRKRGGASTFPANQVEIDHVCVRGSSKWSVRGDAITVVEEDVASDHRPLWTRVVFTRAR